MGIVRTNLPDGDGIGCTLFGLGAGGAQPAMVTARMTAIEYFIFMFPTFKLTRVADQRKKTRNTRRP